MAQPCYSGSLPLTDKERLVVWKWAKEHGGIDVGTPIDVVSDNINKQFFNGMAPQRWMTDIISGRKTPFRQVANDMWRKQYNRRVIQQEARDARELATLGPVAKTIRALWFLPRTAAVFGHGVVFPVTHAGDLAFRPASWYEFVSGALRTYRAAPELWGLGSALGGGKAYAGRMLAAMERDPLFDTALRSKLDVGVASHPVGLISRGFRGPAQRAWDMLTRMRFELWKKEMGKYVKDNMPEAEVNEIGTQLAQWANNATGSGSGPIAKLGGGKVGLLFGPKLTQSKLNRMFADPLTTAHTFYKMARGDETTAGERAVAWTRLSGAVQWMASNVAFLGINQGVLAAFGSKENINFKDPTKGDFWSFKIPGIHGYIPGMHTEVRVLANMLAVAFAAEKPPSWHPQWLQDLEKEWHTTLHGRSKYGQIGLQGAQYAMAKLAPTWQRGLEQAIQQNWEGRPLPGATETGTEKRPKLSWGEYAADIGPIPLSGPVGYTYDKLQSIGMSKGDAIATTKALIWTGLHDPVAYQMFGIGLPGVHVKADTPEKIPAPSLTPPSLKQQLNKLQKQQGITVPPHTMKQMQKYLQKQHP